MNSNTEISQLIQGCKSYDRKAQKALYLLYADELMAIAIRYAKDLPAAKDLVQDTFLKVFNSIQKFEEGKGSLAGWMSRILINQALQGYRRQKRMLSTTEEVFTQAPTEEPSILQQLEAEDILNLLKQLPEGCRIIFNLYVVEGYKHQEIGDILNISASASRSQLTRAKQLLRDLLENKKKIKSLKQERWKSISKTS